MRRVERFVGSLAIAVITIEFPFDTLEGQSNPLLQVSPATVLLNYQTGTPPPLQSLNITSSGAALTYSVSVKTASGGNWLYAGPLLAGSTPGSLVVGLNPSPIVGPISQYPPPGTYTGSVILTADGAANSPVTVPVTLNVTAGAPQMSQVGGFAHIVTGGGWDTTITLINAGASLVAARLKLWDDNGAPLSLTFVAGPNASVTQSFFDLTIPAGGTVVVDLQTQSVTVLAGWAELDAPPVTTIAGFAILQYSATNSIGTTPFTTSTSTALLVPYDNSGFATGVALANQSGTTPANLSLKILDANGTVMGTDSLFLTPNGHTAFMVNGKYPFTSGQRGIIEVGNQSGGVISGLGLRFSLTGSFTSVPVVFQ
jgi:hypothetical protein